MNTAIEFRKNMALSTALHLLAAGAIVASVLVAPKPKLEPIQWIAPSAFSPAPSVSSPSTPAPRNAAPPAPKIASPPQPVEPPRPKPAPTTKTPPVPQPKIATKPAPTSKPVATHKIEPQTAPSKPQIEISQKVVTRQKQSTAVSNKSKPSEVHQPQFSRDEWKKSISQKLSTTTVGVGSPSSPAVAGRIDPFAWYYAHVRDVMFQNWGEPALERPFITQVLITVASDGSLVSHRITVTSGDPIMDTSVLDCLRRIKRIDPLPSELGRETLDITVEFKLHGGK